MTKKISLALAMLGLSAVAFAGAPGDQTVVPSGINLVAPDSVGVWSIGLEAMYVEPTSNEFTYAQTDSVPVAPAVGSYWSNRQVDNEWQWGGTVDLTYMFPGNSRDVKLSWTHLFDSTSSNHTYLAAGQTFFSPITLAANSDLAGAYAKGSVKTQYNAVDLVFGQWIKIGDRLDLHPFGGLRWADVDTTYKQRFNSPVGAAADDYVNSYGKMRSDFDGIGPRAGFDTAVHLGSGFSIVGTFAGSLLVGDINDKTTVTNYTGAAGAAGNITSYYSVKPNHDNTRIVPELDARLGLDYMYAFTPSTSMNVQLGYQVVNYFDVTEGDFASAYNPNTTSSRENWGYQGPYLRLQLNLA